MSSNHKNKQILGIGLVASLGLATIPAIASITPASAVGVNGQVQLNAEVATAIAMKITSPNDTNPDCMVQSGVTYGVANRYATSNGAEGSKQVDTFDGTTGGADELNTNTSCATLTMTPNTFSSTYSDVTVYTNSPNGYAVSLQTPTPDLTNLTNSNYTIPAGTLTESGGTTAGGQNAWSYRTNNGIITNWTAASTTDATIKSYDQETTNGSATRVTYGISAGNNPTGTYATTLTYTATMFDGNNPYVGNIDTDTVSNLTISPTSLKIARNQQKTMTVTPASGYYLSSVTCPTGYTCTGYTTEKSNPASATAQNIAIKNENASNVSVTIGLGVAKLNTMQNFVASEHSSDPVNTSYTLTDARDNKDYRVTKLADNNWWMTQDLKLGEDTALTLTPADSDVSTNFELLAENTGAWCQNYTAACGNQSLMLKTGVPKGYLYNWYAATAGAGVYEISSGSVNTSVCPKGWKLPTSGQAVSLDIAYGGGGYVRGDAAQRNKYMAAPMNFNYTGAVVGSLTGTTYNGQYWTRTADSNTSARFTGFSPVQWFYPGGEGSGGDNGYKYYGLAVRCLASS